MSKLININLKSDYVKDWETKDLIKRKKARKSSIIFSPEEEKSPKPTRSKTPETPQTIKRRAELLAIKAEIQRSMVSDKLVEEIKVSATILKRKSELINIKKTLLLY